MKITLSKMEEKIKGMFYFSFNVLKYPILNTVQSDTRFEKKKEITPL